MKPLLTLILLLSYNLTASGQAKKDSNDFPINGYNLEDSVSFAAFTKLKSKCNLTINGLKEGEWVEYNYAEDEYDAIDTTTFIGYTLAYYKKGIPCGTVRDYSISGQVVGEYPYINGKLNGEVKTYYCNGQLYTLDTYTDSLKNGIFKGFLMDGDLYYEGNFTNGSENGVYKQYYGKGKIQRELPVTYDKWNGVEKYYYESGIIKSENTYRNDTEIIAKEYYKDGKLKSATPYLEGKKGITKLYYEDGNQVLNGIIKEDCDDGQTKTETQLKNGLIEEVRFYNLEGKLEAVETYVNGLEDSFRWAK